MVENILKKVEKQEKSEKVKNETVRNKSNMLYFPRYIKLTHWCTEVAAHITHITRQQFHHITCSLLRVFCVSSTQRLVLALLRMMVLLLCVIKSNVMSNRLA